MRAASASNNSAPAAISKLDGAPGDSTGSGAEKALSAGQARVEVVSSDTQTNLEEQATEMSERKTVLIR